MSRLPDWVVDAVSPTDDERERLEQPVDPALLGGCADVTSPSADEVASLLRRLRQADAPSPLGWLRPAPVLCAVAALLVAALLLWPSPYPPIGVAIELAEGELLELGPSVDLVGPATLVVVERGRVELLDGRLAAEVDPEGRQRTLAIDSGALTTVVVGTRFVVTRVRSRETVAVERGRVRVATPEGDLLLGAGEELTWPEPVEVTASAPSTLPSLDLAPQTPAEPPQEPGPEPVAVLTAPTRLPPVEPAPEEPPAARVLPPGVLIAELGPEIEPDDVRDFGRIQEALEMNTAATSTLVMTERFLAKHRDSSLAAEARIIRLELLAQTAPPRDAISDLDRWLAANPDDPQFLRLLELRADTARDGLRDPRGALPGYRVLATRARGERRARAQAFRGLCAYSEGLDDEAIEALTEALINDFLPEALRFEVSEALAALESARTVLPMRKAQ